ncbi:hypothetical protein BV20DRAFT_355109 [Pilatotrama ljubarskyi]|nr:hypothetical protein BV20DRAFT_355109 [Pilatotrama ljubarskyi]
MPHLRSLTYLGFKWLYPPTCHWQNLVARGSITTLVLNVHLRDLSDLFRLVWALTAWSVFACSWQHTRLKTCDDGVTDFSRLGNLASRKPRCRSLKVLKLQASVEVPKSLYSIVLGTSITDLTWNYFFHDLSDGDRAATYCTSQTLGEAT